MATCHKGQNSHFAFTEETGFQVAEDVDVLLYMKINLKSGCHIGESQDSHTAKNFIATVASCGLTVV